MTDIKLIVGTPECPLAEVVAIVISDEFLSLLFDYWPDIALELSIPGQVTKSWKKKDLHDDMTLKEILKELVEIWAKSNDKTAFLDDLRKVFKNNHLTSLSQRLKEKFSLKKQTDKSKQDVVEKLRSEETMNSVLNREEIEIYFDSVDGKQFPKDAIVLPKENKGCAFILNIFDFPKGSGFGPRFGSLEDVKQLNKLLTKLGFKTFPKPEIQEKKHKEKKEVLDLVDKFLIFCKENEAKSAFVFVGSHGIHPNKIITSDVHPTKNGKVEVSSVDLYKDIVARFYNNNCAFLKEKPKMFLVQACQEFVEIGEASDSSGETDSFKTKPLGISNIVMCLSTHHGGVSYRNEYNGTYLVQYFIRAMKGLVGKGVSYQEICKEVVDTLTDVSRRREHTFQVPYYYVVPSDMKNVYFEV